MLVVGGRLLAFGCWLLVVGSRLPVVGCWLLVVGRWLLVVGCWLSIVGWSLLVETVVVCLFVFVFCWSCLFACLRFCL